MPLLVGLDGVKKMSKSQDNYIAFSDSSKDMFGKIMSISDSAMWDYYQYLLEATPEAIAEKKAGHPMDAKKHLAVTLVERFHGEGTGKHELQQFEQVFSQGQRPDDMPSFPWNTITQENTVSIVDLMQATELFPSKKEIRRLIEQGAVYVEDDRCQDPKMQIDKPNSPLTLRAGKRTFFEVTE